MGASTLGLMPNCFSVFPEKNFENNIQFELLKKNNFKDLSKIKFET